MIKKYEEMTATILVLVLVAMAIVAINYSVTAKMYRELLRIVKTLEKNANSHTLLLDRARAHNIEYRAQNEEFK